MKRPYRATISFDVPVFASSPEEAVEVVNRNIHDIFSDSSGDIVSESDITEIHPQKWPNFNSATGEIESGYVMSVDFADELMYGAENDVTVRDWFKENTTLLDQPVIDKNQLTLEQDVAA